MTTALPPTLQRHPRPAQWLRFAAGRRVQVLSGKVEIGQGLQATLAAIVAEELDWPLPLVQVLPVDTATHPDEGVTSGSLSVQDSGGALRIVAAAVRGRLLDAAAQRFGVAREAVRCEGGCIVCEDGRQAEAADLATSVETHVATDPATVVAADPSPVAATGADLHVLRRPLHAADSPPKALTAHQLIGGPLPRPELRALLSGGAHFIHDLALPGLLHGRVLHPPHPTMRPADDAAARAVCTDAAALAGVVAVRADGALFGVLARTPAQADAALARLQAGIVWGALPSPATDGADPADPVSLLRAPSQTRVVAEHGTPGTALRRVRARYSKPWVAHASVGLSCALAQRDGDTLAVWTHSQGPFNLRRDLALAFGLADDAVTVRHVPGAGCYGHNGADDVAYDAAWLAQSASGWPVRVLWSRADELARAPLGPAMVVALEAGLDAQGEIVDWQHTLWSPGHSSRPGRSATPTLLGHAEVAGGAPLPAAIDMPLAVGGGAERNAIPGYALPAWRVVAHRVETPWRSSALRSLGAFANVFAVESFIDELAAATAQDPLALRRRLLAHDARGLAVLEAAVAAAGCSDWAARPRREGTGFGLGYARYKNTGAWCAVVAEVQAGATLAVRRLQVAVDVGQALHPDGVRLQIEGGALQAASWALKEAVPSRGGLVALERWSDYPVLRFTELPDIDVRVLPSDAPPLGAGEASLGPTAAAIANALADALDVRVRDLPLTPAHIVAAMDEA
jgi:nicotinate dehydrogenase subunit B